MGDLNGMELFYWVAFLFGLGYAAIGLVAGGLGGGHEASVGDGSAVEHEVSVEHEAAIAQMFIDRLPEIARAVAEPLSKTERIVIIGQGGDGAGASRVTRDVTEIMAQLPAVMEALTGLNLQDVLRKIPALGDLQAEGVDKVAAHDGHKESGG